MPVPYPQPAVWDGSSPQPGRAGGQTGEQRRGRSAHHRASAAHPGADPLRDAELVAIVDALRDPRARREGLTRSELRERLGAGSWEPGRLAPALRHAVATGLVLEIDLGRYAFADPHPL